jgi:hypothetical protein
MFVNISERVYILGAVAYVLIQGSLTEREGSVRLTYLCSCAFYDEYRIYLCYKTRYLNEEVNCTEPFPSVSVPWGLYYKTFYGRSLQIFVIS